MCCGIKRSKKRDLGLLYSFLPCAGAGVFTANKVKAAPVLVCQEQLKKNNPMRAIIVNSGNANCFVGSRGVTDARETIRAAAQELGVAAGSVLVASTGIIGKALPVDKIKKALPQLCSSTKSTESGLEDFAESVLTTDTFKKIVSVRVALSKDQAVTITGVVKGAGMISPHLETGAPHATMLCFIATDARIKKGLLQSALNSAAEQSFNCISIDGCMSTNDTVLVLANGAASEVFIQKKDKDFRAFELGLARVCEQLAKKLVEDGEGATKFIEINIIDAKDKKEAREAANAVANSALFKTAMYGNNPNWGRIVAAIGAAGIPLHEKKVTVAFNGRLAYGRGKIFSCPPDILSKRFIRVDVNLNKGQSRHRFYTCDFSKEYVDINAAYN